MEIKPIAHIRTDFPEKFGVPRQSGLAERLKGMIVFEKEYRNPEALRGLEGFSHLWLIWEFSANRRGGKSVSERDWQPTVRPPRLGGNEYMGVFATRSPFRPNPLGLSCVEMERVDYDDKDGPVLYVKGADLMDGTPIYDIKPYIKYADSRPHALCGYVDSLPERTLKVFLASEHSDKIEDKSILPALVEVLSLDPRPSYHDDPERIYGLSFAGYNVRFKVADKVLTVVDVE
jgi:tRNA-Thr(GGU) m(6)t(6)A37 methyltransferase TsaA